MKFGKDQQETLKRNWNNRSWFYCMSAEDICDYIQCAYGLKVSKPITAAQYQKFQPFCQEFVSAALYTFARKLGCKKSHVVHALLTGSVSHLLQALERQGTPCTLSTMRKHWCDSFQTAQRTT